jgi:cell division protein ZapA
MAQVRLSVAGRSYDIACGDGGEPHLEMLASMVDAKAREAGQAVGNANEPRQLLLAALLLADELCELRSGAPDPAKAAFAQTLDRLSERLESLADRLEHGASPT